MSEDSFTDQHRQNSDGQVRRLANLKSFPKGVSGNPAGRPKYALLSDALRRKLSEIDPEDSQKRTYAEVLAEKMIEKAKTGDVQALREIVDRVEGKARQTITLSIDRREQLEAAVYRILENAQNTGVSLTREEAINDLSLFVPEVKGLLS